MIPSAAIPIGSEEIVAVLCSLFTGADATSDDVAKFEKDLAIYLGGKKVFAFNSGRTALHTALQSLNLKRGDEVIVPAYTCAIVFEVVLRLGLKPVFVDVSRHSYNIDPELIREAITSKTKVIIPVHLFGHPCDMDLIVEIAEKYGLYIIEDAAQALGAEYKGKKVGTFLDLAMFSFGPGKVITGGGGGAVLLNNPELEPEMIQNYEKLPCSSLSNVVQAVRNVLALYMFSNSFTYPFVKNAVDWELERRERQIVENTVKLLPHSNSSPSLSETIVLEKMPNIVGAIASRQVKKIDTIIRKRRRNAATIFNEIMKRDINEILIPLQEAHIKDIYTRCVVQVRRLDIDLIRRICQKNGVDVVRPYSYLEALLISMEVKAPNSLQFAKSALALPNHPCLNTSDALKVVDVLEKAVKAVKC